MMKFSGLLVPAMACWALLAVSAVNAKDNIRTRNLSNNNMPNLNEAELAEDFKKKKTAAQQKNKLQPLKKLPKAPTDEFHVFQISGTHVASTLTVNILTGLFEDRNVYRSYVGKGWKNEVGKKTAPWNSTIVSKSHKRSIPEYDNRFGQHGSDHQFENLFFVGNIRAEENSFLPDGYCDPNNEEYNWRMVCLEFENLLFETMDELRDVIHYVAESVKKIPYFSKIDFDEEEAVQRIVLFTDALEKCYDPHRKFGIGGGNSCSHRIKDESGGADPYLNEAEKKKTAAQQKNKLQPLNKLPKAPTDEFHVFQISGANVASTLTVNILTGLFEDRNVYRSYVEKGWKNEVAKKTAPWNSTIVSKSHKRSIPEFDNHFGPHGSDHQFENLFFVGNIRAEENSFLPDGYCDPTNEEYNWRMVCLEFENLLFETMDELHDVIHYVAESVKKIPYFSKINFDEEEAVQRIVLFTDALEKCHDPHNKFGIGGGNSCSHRIKDESGGADP